MKKNHYTTDQKHPEDEISRVKTFITELQTVQEEYYEKLVKNLRIEGRGEEHLFDYIYNERAPILFEEYLENHRSGPYESHISELSPLKEKKTTKKSAPKKPTQTQQSTQKPL